MPPFAMAHQKDNEPERYNETVGSAVVADALKARNGWLRGGFSINGVEFHNFETNSPENMIAQLNARQAQTGVYAELDEGKLKLSHQHHTPIRIASGAGYQPPNRNPGQKPPPAEENTLLADLGLQETTELNEAAAAQQANANGMVPQVGDGSIPAAPVSKPQPGSGGAQTAEEIEAANIAMMRNERGPNPMGTRAPHAPHETVPGTTTTGNRPQPEPGDSNAERVVVQPGQETALQGQPLRDGASAATTGAASQADGTQAPGTVQDDDDGHPHMSDAETDADPDYGSRTNEELRQHARDHGVNLQGATNKADIIRAIKKHDRKVAREKEKQGG